MKGILINGSPKRNGSASGVLLDDLRSLLAPDTETAAMAVTAAHPAASPDYTGMHWEPSPEEQKKLDALQEQIDFQQTQLDFLAEQLDIELPQPPAE